MGKHSKLTREDRKEIRLNEFAKAFISKFATKSDAVKGSTIEVVLDVFESANTLENTDDKEKRLSDEFGLTVAEVRRPLKGFLRANGVRNENDSTMSVVKKFERLSAKLDKENSRHDAAVKKIEADIESLGGKDAIRAKFESLAARFR